jgi:hypothetical protein
VARLQPVDPGWIDLAANVPVMSTSRIRELGWQPRRTAEQVLRELIEAIREGRGTGSPALAPRASLSRAVGSGRSAQTRLGLRGSSHS